MEQRHVRGSLPAERGGFSLIELLMTLSIIGILAGLAIPNLRQVTFRARAAEVIADLDVVRVGTQQHLADTQTWPPEDAQGVVPPSLAPYLPEGFSFIGNGYELDYDNLSPVVIPGDPGTSRLLAVAVIADTDELSNAVVELLGGSLIYSVGRRHTVMIDRN